MSEFLKETDKLLGKAVKSINDNLFTDTDKDANEREEEKESSTSQKEVEKPTPKKTERLKSVEEDEEPSVWGELKKNRKEYVNEFILYRLLTTEGFLALLCVIAFILLWMFAGFGWAVAVAILGLAIWDVKKMMQ